MKFKIIIWLLLLSFTSNATNYYLSNSGSDSNNGTNKLTPWASITKLNTQSLAAGDSVLFQRGGLFTGAITINNSGTSGNPIIFSAYGTGNKPIISGFQTVWGWTDQGNGIYRTVTSAANTCNMVTVNGVNTPMGRYPKTGWLTFESYSGITSITDNQLSASPNWTGGEVVIRKYNWIVDRSAITNHTGTTITYTSGSSYAVSSEGLYSYFIQKSPYACTSLGEWYISGGYIYMYFGGATIANYTVQTSITNRLIYASGRNYIKIVGLKFEGSNTDAIYFNGATNGITVTGCEFINHGGNAVKYNYCNNSAITDNTFTDINGTAIDFAGDGQTITDNTISKVGVNAGMGDVGGSTYIGIKARGASGTIQYNSVINVGYLPIWFSNTAATVAYNLADNFCQHITDGGGIYSFYGNDTTLVMNIDVHHNIVLNSNGNGLYSDGVSNHINFHDNTVYNINKFGIHQNQPRLNTVQNNLFYDCFIAMDLNNLDYLSVQAYGTTATGNTIVQQNTNQWLWQITDGRNNKVELKNSSNNNKLFFYTGTDTIAKNRTIYPSYSHVYQNLAQLQATGWENTSSVTYRATNTDLQFEYNASKSPKVINLSQAKIDLVSGTTYNTSVTLQPYTSILLYPAPVSNPLNWTKVLTDATGKPLLDADGKPLLIP